VLAVEGSVWRAEQGRERRRRAAGVQKEGLAQHHRVILVLSLSLPIHLLLVGFVALGGSIVMTVAVASAAAEIITATAAVVFVAATAATVVVVVVSLTGALLAARISATVEADTTLCGRRFNASVLLLLLLMLLFLLLLLSLVQLLFLVLLVLILLLLR
jgi:hypothetical protein